MFVLCWLMNWFVGRHSINKPIHFNKKINLFIFIHCFIDSINFLWWASPLHGLIPFKKTSFLSFHQSAQITFIKKKAFRPAPSHKPTHFSIWLILSSIKLREMNCFVHSALSSLFHSSNKGRAGHCLIELKEEEPRCAANQTSWISFHSIHSVWFICCRSLPFHVRLLVSRHFIH